MEIREMLFSAAVTTGEAFLVWALQTTDGSEEKRKRISTALNGFKKHSTELQLNKSITDHVHEGLKKAALGEVISCSGLGRMAIVVRSLDRESEATLM
eukprot:6492781-Amphidinium_carterae.2